MNDEIERTGLDPALANLLDPGEAAAIALAELLRADALLIDERKGRAVARARGLRIQGTLGGSSRRDVPASSVLSGQCSTTLPTQASA